MHHTECCVHRSWLPFDFLRTVCRSGRSDTWMLRTVESLHLVTDACTVAADLICIKLTITRCCRRRQMMSQTGEVIFEGAHPALSAVKFVRTMKDRSKTGLPTPRTHHLICHQPAANWGPSQLTCSQQKRNHNCLNQRTARLTRMIEENVFSQTNRQCTTSTGFMECAVTWLVVLPR